MTIEQVGIFRLIDPPPGQADVIRAAVAAINFPWERLGETTIDVLWTTEGANTASASYWNGPDEIRMSGRPHHMDNPDSVAFAFAHEVGHMVDDRLLTDDARVSLTKLLHSQPDWLHTADHEHHEAEDWKGDGEYYAGRLNEAYADQFVAAFAPSLWEGHYPRFVHWTDNHQAIRDLTLYPLPEPEVKAASVEKRPRRRLRRGWRKRVRRLVWRIMRRVRRRR